MPVKRRRADVESEASPSRAPQQHVPKKPRLGLGGGGGASSSRDLLSPLSDELLIRILINLSLPHLLDIAPVSRRFHRLSEDSQLWKRLYYSRFVLPRALRIPGFRDGSAREGKLHYSSRRAVWADGRRGGWVDMRCSSDNKDGNGGGGDRATAARDWKRQYKLRHNWARGKCAVEELQVGDEDDMAVTAAETSSKEDETSSRKMLVKVCEGTAITADATGGLRAWDLKTKQLVAHISLDNTDADEAPSCLALDDQKLTQQHVDIAIGFHNGSFGVWTLDLRNRSFTRKYRHKKSTNGALAGVAYSHPYLLTATESVLISLYTFDRPLTTMARRREFHEHSDAESETGGGSDSEMTREDESHDEGNARRRHNSTYNSKLPQSTTQPDQLAAPYLLTSLKSHTSRAPLALSIRKTAGSTIASIAYTFSTLQGWSLGIQDLHLKPSIRGPRAAPDIAMTRLAYTIPVKTATSHIPSPPGSPARPPQTSARAGAHEAASAAEEGPISICYTHPYLLATLPDNTLILYLCTSGASSLTISPGIRLWGHTSGISDAEITARGKAVSVSCRGEEIRVWELEGRADGRSIEVRPTAPSKVDSDDVTSRVATVQSALDERRNWVGFDDEMVIVLKESRGRESLMVYDFT